MLRAPPLRQQVWQERLEADEQGPLPGGDGPLRRSAHSEDIDVFLAEGLRRQTGGEAMVEETRSEGDLRWSRGEQDGTAAGASATIAVDAKPGRAKLTSADAGPPSAHLTLLAHSWAVSEEAAGNVQAGIVNNLQARHSQRGCRANKQIGQACPLIRLCFGSCKAQACTCK